MPGYRYLIEELITSCHVFEVQREDFTSKEENHKNLEANNGGEESFSENS
jgi:hypothetical protein